MLVTKIAGWQWAQAVNSSMVPRKHSSETLQPSIESAWSNILAATGDFP